MIRKRAGTERTLPLLYPQPSPLPPPFPSPPPPPPTAPAGPCAGRQHQAVEQAGPSSGVPEPGLESQWQEDHQPAGGLSSGPLSAAPVRMWRRLDTRLETGSWTGRRGVGKDGVRLAHYFQVSLAHQQGLGTTWQCPFASRKMLVGHGRVKRSAHLFHQEMPAAASPA